MNSRHIRWALCLLGALTLFHGCRRTFGIADDSGELSPEGQTALKSIVDLAQLPDLQYPDFRNDRTEVQQFYEPAYDKLPWVLGRLPSRQAQALIGLFKHAEEEGLNPADYDGPRWEGRLSALNSGRGSESELVRFDLAVTISAMRYVSDLHRGRVNPRKFHFDLEIENTNFDLSDFLRQRLVGAEDVDAVMKSVEPPFPAYRQTVDALRTYLAIVREDDGAQLPPSAKSIKPGDSYDGVPRLERLLSLLGDLPKSQMFAVPGLPYSEPLVSAVKHFQRRHGLEPSGIIDAHTLKELNTPLSQRVLQLELTLERWRWLPHQFDEPPIVVNIPEFRLYVSSQQYRPAFSMNVVVGRSFEHQTPVFATQLKSVIFRPYWNVPLKIQREELLPALKRDSHYLRDHSYEIVDAHGNVVSDDGVSEAMEQQLESGKLAIRQKPGQDNSLGLVKFDMPNVYDIYMHDTPATQLFSRSRRDFSHGCIRVENPVALAEWALRDKPEWDADRIRDAMQGDQTLRVSPARPVPVLILYGTAVVREDGEIDFFDDIYGLDAILNEAIAKGYPYQSNQKIGSTLGNSLPAPNGSEIHVDKAGSRIVPDSSTMQIQRRVAQTGGRHSRDANIDCFSSHVLAMFGNSLSRAPKILVAPGCAIAADDVNFGFGTSHGGSQVAQEIEKSRIERGYVARSVISQEMVEPRDCVRNI